MDLHRCMGHITPRATQEQVRENFVVGLTLIDSDELQECKACIKAKLICHEVVKEHEGEHATAFGQEIWLDLGLPKVPTLGRWRYFVSFTDDCT